MLRKLFHRGLNWRSWPMQVMYLPTTVYALLLGLRHGNVFYLSLANPKILLGGFVLDSKYKQNLHIPKAWQLLTFRVVPTASLPLAALEGKLHFPCFVKPDVGEGGKGVLEIKELQELHDYHQCAKVPYLIQEKANGSQEYSLLVYRSSKAINIKSITKREPLRLIGNGSHTIEKHIEKLPFTKSKRRRIEQTCQMELQFIPGAKQTVQINTLGNFDFGATYTQCHTPASAQLSAAIHSILDSLKHYNIARLDVKTNSWDALQNGAFQVLEVNGLNAEPIHIYDPHYSFFGAQKEIFQHWQQIYLHSKRNAKLNAQRTRLRTGIRYFKQHLILTRHAKN